MQWNVVTIIPFILSFNFWYSYSKILLYGDFHTFLWLLFLIGLRLCLAAYFGVCVCVCV